MQPLQEIIAQFISEVRSDGKKGLWVYGPRRSGTSHCGRRAVDEVIENFPELVKKHGQGQRMTAIGLESKLRSVWTQEALMRVNADDMLLWQETNQLLDNWEFLWNCSILFIDDLISVDIEFWKKHLLARIDERLKTKTVTIIASVHGPEKFGPEWSKAFRDLCKVYRLEER